MTTFTVTPRAEGVLTRIESVLPDAHRLDGAPDSFVAPHWLEPLFTGELALLAAYAEKLAAAQAEIPGPGRTPLPE